MLFFIHMSGKSAFAVYSFCSLKKPSFRCAHTSNLSALFCFPVLLPIKAKTKKLFKLNCIVEWLKLFKTKNGTYSYSTWSFWSNCSLEWSLKSHFGYCFVTLGKLPEMPIPPPPHLYNLNSNRIYCIRIVTGVKWDNT